MRAAGCACPLGLTAAGTPARCPRPSAGGPPRLQQITLKLAAVPPITTYRRPGFRPDNRQAPRADLAVERALKTTTATLPSDLRSPSSQIDSTPRHPRGAFFCAGVARHFERARRLYPAQHVLVLTLPTPAPSKDAPVVSEDRALADDSLVDDPMVRGLVVALVCSGVLSTLALVLLMSAVLEPLR